jgi:hypothetical protein
MRSLLGASVTTELLTLHQKFTETASYRTNGHAAVPTQLQLCRHGCLLLLPMSALAWVYNRSLSFFTLNKFDRIQYQCDVKRPGYAPSTTEQRNNVLFEDNRLASVMGFVPPLQPCTCLPPDLLAFLFSAQVCLFLKVWFTLPFVRSCLLPSLSA